MADPDRPEFDHVLFGVVRDTIVFGDSSDLPRGWDRLRRNFHPDSERGGDTAAVHTRFTTDDLDWWRTFAEGRIDVTEALTDLVVLASGLPRQPVSYLTPVAHGLVAEYLEQQAYLVSPDWPTYLVNVWVIATRLAEPEIRRAHETRTELDLAHPLRRIPTTDGRIVVQKDWNRRRPCPKASVAAVRQYRRIGPQLRQLTSYILQFQADRRERRRIAAFGGGSLEPTPYSCTGARGSELPPTPPFTHFGWETQPQFYPRAASDRAERVGFRTALERGDVTGPFSLLTQYPFDSPYPFRPEQFIQVDHLTEWQCV